MATEKERIFIVRVEAKDEDKGENGRVRYALAPHSDVSTFPSLALI